ncbi:hypothetical protein SCP_1601930 [Sparassis crispa]|uniref:BTB domain-containing protein n=1 Tax=Sparassis crispa TaxID=139825 RepID=A0A401H565_9APHY|nr:hypothetical protein SCP_1601930 [Sparassis crispa]GBE89531.1 hypothetical protein SCP_1601930 [Sparassis crispa]
MLTAEIPPFKKPAKRAKLTADTNVSATMLATDTDAPYPFDKPNADTILRTSDRVKFRVRNAILAEASVFFEGMFSCPQPPDSQQCDGLPVVDVAEDSKTLDALLRFCYPFDPPELATLDELVPVLRAALKYVMDPFMVSLRKQLVAVAEKEPMGVYMIAYELGFKAEMLAAEKYLQDEWCNTYYPGLEEMPVEVYFKLLKASLAGEPSEPEQPPSSFRSSKLRKKSAKKSGRPEEHRETPAEKPDNRFHDCGLINPSEHKTTAAEYPFDLSDADAVLCTSDAVEFCVHTSILSIASPVFRHMFTGTEKDVMYTKHEPSSRRPTGMIVVTEDSRTLTALLRFCYPVEDQEVEDLEWAGVLLRVAKKYQMATAMKRLREIFAKFAQERPLRAYAIACVHQWDLEGKQAARVVLRVRIKDHSAEDLKGISAGTYHRLLKYHKDCAKAASSKVEEDLNGGKLDRAFMQTRNIICCNCGHRAQTENYRAYIGCWWRGYVRRVALELEEKPDGETAKDAKLLGPAIADAQTCIICEPSTFQDLWNCSVGLASKIDYVVSRVSIEIR